MKIRHVMLILLFVTNAAALAGDEVTPEPKTITIEALSRLKIIGKLGIPLGKYAEFKAIVVGEGSLHDKQMRRYRLKVISVAGKDLKEPVTMVFRNVVKEIKFLPESPTELKESKTGDTYKNLTDEWVNELEKGYVGSEVKFTGYETADFLGMPDGMPNPEQWQDGGGGGDFAPRSILVVFPPSFEK